MADSNAAAERAEREERLASDLEEVEAKLNNCRENVETLMLQVKKYVTWKKVDYWQKVTSCFVTVYRQGGRCW